MINVNNFLNKPNTKLAMSYTIFMILLVYLSIIEAVVQVRNPDVFDNYIYYFNILEIGILSIFTIEFTIRVLFSNNRLNYIFSLYGIIDIIIIFPSIILILLSYDANILWLRVLLIFRMLRIVKFAQYSKNINGIVSKLLPYLGVALGFKAVVLMIEIQEWYPTIDNLKVVIGVIGFALAVLLGTKLSVVNNRIYQIEDTVCRIVGSLRDMKYSKNIQNDLLSWSSALEKTLKSPLSNKTKVVSNMRDLTDKLEQTLEKNSIGGPNTAGFHRDVAYLLHRTTAKTPIAYENFLKLVTMFYTITVIFAVPGITGLITTFLIVFVLGGMYFLIDDMDNPLDFDDNSVIDVRLDALEYFNKEN